MLHLQVNDIAGKQTKLIRIISAILLSFSTTIILYTVLIVSWKTYQLQKLFIYSEDIMHIYRYLINYSCILVPFILISFICYLKELNRMSLLVVLPANFFAFIFADLANFYLFFN